MNKDQSDKVISIGYVSSGKLPTGGYHYETFFTQQISDYLIKKGVKVNVLQHRQWRYFHGLQNIMLMFWGWKRSNSAVNIVTGRIGLSAFLRNVFSSRKTIVVLHNFDTHYLNSIYLKIYYNILFNCFRILRPKNICIVTGAKYWVAFFERRLDKGISVFGYPNLFDTYYYQSLKQKKQAKLICLGQFSGKNDSLISELADKLTYKGYSCYFATMNPNEVMQTPTYQILCESKEAYLKRLASAEYCLALTAINEGWNRMAHESILLGTPVIGYAKGGLGDLLQESNSFIVSNIEEAFQVILSNQVKTTSNEFIKRYDTQSSFNWLKPIIAFINN